MTANLTDVPRAEKLSITTLTHTALIERQNAGPPEPALDAFIPELAAVAAALSTHVTGKDLANAAREKHLGRIAIADDAVDTRFRHIEAFVSIEANRRTGPNVIAAQSLYKAAFPDGLARIDDRVPDQNIHVRATLNALQSPEHAATLQAIELPSAWINALDVALKESNDAVADLARARGDKSSHVELGKSAEADWVDLMVRLRRYIASRAKRTDIARIAEGQEILKPLLDAVQKLRVTAAARATRRTKKDAGAGSTSAAPEMPRSP